MAVIGRGPRVARTFCALLLAACVAGAAVLTLRAPSAAAEEGDLDAQKAHWQSLYRKLRVDEARLVETVKLANKEYADANRRTYRRSGVRHLHRENANKANAELAIVRAKIESTFSDVVAAGGSVNWLYEVDDEPIDPSRVEGLGVYEDEGPFGGKGAYTPGKRGKNGADVPAAGGDPGAIGDEGPREESYDDGRNPLYSDDEDAVEDDDPTSGDD